MNKLTLTAGTVVTIKAATAALKDMNDVFSELGEGIREAFAVRGYQDYLQTVKRFGKSLADQLLTLQMSFGRLKVAMAQAFAPIVQVVVPYINQAINAIIRFANTLGQVLAGVFAGITGNQDLAKSAENAADAENTLKTAATSAGKAVRRSVMGFDELNRLNAPTKGGGSGGEIITPGGITVGPQAQAIAEKILAVLARVRELLSPIIEALRKLFSVVGNHLRWLWETILAPFAGWVAETLAPALSDFFAAGIQLVTAALGPLLEGLQGLWTGLQPIAAFIGQTIIQCLQDWKAVFEDLTATLELRGGSITAIFQNIGQVLGQVWAAMEPVFQMIREVGSQVFRAVGSSAGEMVGNILQVLSGLTTFLAGIFTGDWKQCWQGLLEFLRGTVNSVIGFFNAMAAGITGALNGVIKGANKLSFTIPSWVPGVGGKAFGLNLKTITAPKIPYLAKGAVLPANKPFLAVVGDQRSGTNVEAPLDTIRQAVALELGAGIQSMIAEQRRTRQAISQIRVGDSVIGRAAQRYTDALLAITGGV